MPQVDSVEQPLEHKAAIWRLLADEWKPEVLTTIVKQIGLEELPAALKEVREGKAVGRYVVKHF